MMRDPKTGRNQREGKWQIMIHGESYKPIVAEAARKAATEVYNRIMVTHLLMDKARPNRVAGAVRFNRPHGISTSSAPRQSSSPPAARRTSTSPARSAKAWRCTLYAPWSSASAYALPILVGAKMTQVPNPILAPSILKDGALGRLVSTSGILCHTLKTPMEKNTI